MTFMTSFSSGFASVSEKSCTCTRNAPAETESTLIEGNFYWIRITTVMAQ